MKAVSILNKFDVLAFSMGSPNENHRSSSGLAQFKVQTQKLKKKRFSFLLYIRKWNNTTEISELENENKKTHPEKIYFILGNGTI